MRVVRFALVALGVCLLVCMAGSAFAQNRSTGEIRGTVTDASGAVLPGVTVTLNNVDTGEAKDFTTNGDGIFDTVSTPTGHYNITYSKAGFKKLTRGPITLDVTTITEDATLQVGAVTEEVRVSAEGAPLLDTETGQQATTLETKIMNDLPQIGAGITGNDWANFNAFLPGAGSAPHGRASEGSGPWNSGDAVELNGNLPNYANFLADGATTQLPVSNNNDNMVLETVQEVQVTTSSFSAQYGMGGAVFNQISKGGTNTFHGSAYEYWQNNFLNAPNYSFTPGAVGHVSYQRYDEWGGSIGGPIIKNKLFFYFDRDKIYQFGGASPAYATVPTDNMKAGNFINMPPIYDPTTTTGTLAALSYTRTQFAGNQITTIDPVAQKILAGKYWPEPNVAGNCSTTYTALCTNNYLYIWPSPNPNLRYFGRIDYDLSSDNRITFSISQKDNPGYDKNAMPCPINCYSGDIDGYQAQVTDTWTVSPTFVNELRYGYTKQGNWFVPATSGFDPTAQLGLQYDKFLQFPNFNVSGVNGLNAGTYAIYIENLYDPSDVVTLIRGKHILHFGLEVLMGEGNTTPWGAHDAGSFAFNGNYTKTGVCTNAAGTVVLCTDPTATKEALNANTGSGFADFLLGDVQTWNATNQGLSGGRIKNSQAFIQDDFKVKPNFTLNLGLRWNGSTGISEEHHRLGMFDPTIINTVGPYAGTLGAMWFAPQNGRNTLMKPVWDIFLPRVGFAWSIRNDTTIRGGFGMYAYNYSWDTYGNGIGTGSNQTGSITDLTGGTSPTPIIYLGGSTLYPQGIVASGASVGKPLPYLPASVQPRSYVQIPPYSPGGVQPYTTQPGRISEWSLTVEHQFAKDFAASVAYVGSHGSNLQYPMAYNQITNPAQLAQNDVSGCDGTGTNPAPCYRPYPAFGGSIGGNTYNAISNYDSLQVQLNKRYSNGLTFNLNYVWSHFLDDQDSAGWGSTAGNQNWQIANNPASNYSNSNFDIRHAFHGVVSYELPFGKGKPYANNGVADYVVGGWRIASTFIAQGGNPFTMWDSNDLSYAQGGETWYPNPTGTSPKASGSCANGSAVGTIGCWFNPAAFAQPAPGTFGLGRRNSVYGPGLTVVNLSLAKDFKWRERIGLELKMDFVNALNHPSFNLPNSDANPSNTSEGLINSVVVGPRTGQLSARLSF